jgi:hypothetical protein
VLVERSIQKGVEKQALPTMHPPDSRMGIKVELPEAWLNSALPPCAHPLTLSSCQYSGAWAVDNVDKQVGELQGRAVNAVKKLTVAPSDRLFAFQLPLTCTHEQYD